MVAIIHLNQVTNVQNLGGQQNNGEITEFHASHILASAGSLIEDIPVAVGRIPNAYAHHSGLDVGILGKTHLKVHTEEFLIVSCFHVVSSCFGSVVDFVIGC